MNEICFLDETVRDGQQSLWATRMTTAMMLPIAPVMESRRLQVGQPVRRGG